MAYRRKKRAKRSMLMETSTPAAGALRPLCDPDGPELDEDDEVEQG
ncbi:hypothetical protein [Streptomyces roseifaciens]|nr:hypothetical protein [Streptomyces roseifaciens]